MYEKKYQARVLKQDENISSKKKVYFPWKRLLIIVIILTIISGGIYLIKYPKFQIVNINVVGTSVIDNGEVSTSIKDHLVGRVLWFLPRTSVFLIRDNNLEKILKKEFSRIETVRVKRTSLNTLLVTIKEFDAQYLWCLPSDTGDNCYFMDKQGIVYSQAPVFSGSAYIKIFTGAPLDKLPFLGVSAEDLGRIVKIKKQLLDINIDPVAIRFVSPRETKVDFMHNKNLAELIVDPTVSIDTSLEYLFSGIRTDPLSSLFHDETKVLLYIDVRFPNKVVYKFQ